MSLMEFIRRDLASELKCGYNVSIVHLVVSALQTLDSAAIPDLQKFIQQHGFALHNVLIFADCNLFSQELKEPIAKRIQDLISLSSKISNFVFESASYGELAAGWESSIKHLEALCGLEFLGRSFVARFVYVIYKTTQDIQESLAAKRLLAKQKTLILTQRTVVFLQKYALIETVGWHIAGQFQISEVICLDLNASFPKSRSRIGLCF